MVSPENQPPDEKQQLRDVLGHHIATRPHPQSYADAVLASPDLQALKLWLKHESASHRHNFGVPAAQQMRDRKLSDTFIEWVLS